MVAQAYNDGSYRIRAGAYNAQDLTEAYEVLKFPRQADQYYDWLPPLGESAGVYDEFQDLAIALGQNAVGHGNASFAWRFARLSPAMAFYIKNDASMFNGKRSRLFTVMTWDSAGTWRVVHATARLDKQSVNSRNGTPDSGMAHIDVPFAVLREAPQGPDVSPDYTTGAPFFQSIETNVLLRANNDVGPTTDDIILTATLPAQYTYVSTTAPAGWSMEYFESGMWETSVTVPANVTAIRGTWAGLLDAGESTDDITLRIDPTTIGTHIITLTATTSDDIDNGNDSADIETETE